MKRIKLKLPTVPLPESLPGEGDRFYQRFLVFALAGPHLRSVDAVFQAEQSAGGKGKKRQPPGSFYRAAETWRWRDRAAEYDNALAVAEATELELARKVAREERAALVTKFVASAAVLLDDPTILASMPAGTSAAVLRAVEASRREFGAETIPADANAANETVLSKGKFPNTQPPQVEIFIDNGDGTRGRLSDQPPPDVYDPTRDHLATEQEDGEASYPPECDVQPS